MSNCPSWLSAVRKHNLDPRIVSGSLKSLRSAICCAEPSLHGLYRFFLSHCHGAMSALLQALASIDEAISACACEILSFCVAGDVLAVGEFVVLGGVRLVSDLLCDYSDTVLVADFALVAALAPEPLALRELVETGAIVRISALLNGAMEKVSKGDTQLSTVVACLQLIEGLAAPMCAPADSSLVDSVVKALFPSLNRLFLRLADTMF